MSSLAVMENYYPDSFPSFWEHMNALAAAKRVHSVSEVRKELPKSNTRDFLLAWVDGQHGMFPTPTAAETTFVAGIFAVPQFQALVKQKSRLKGSPVADPWVIARAATLSATVVTEESARPQIIRIPAVCKHFGIPCINVERLMADVRMETLRLRSWVAVPAWQKRGKTIGSVGSPNDTKSLGFVLVGDRSRHLATPGLAA